jgi:3-isopropylmalate/(R)-2-methylmalate dehydratase large subunit
MTARTLYEKLWSSHLVREKPDGTALIYIDRHLVHEVTSPQAFEGLEVPTATLADRLRHRHRRPQRPHHRRPRASWHRRSDLAPPGETLDANVVKFHVNTYFGMNDLRQGIVHVIGPEQGATLPGMTVVCGDSHTSTHGAFAALAFGIGTSEVEHVLATQCLMQKKSKTLLVRAEGALPTGVTAKDLVLAVIGRLGIWGGAGSVIEYPAAPSARSRWRADDGLQHVDRGGRARGDLRVRRDHHRLPARPPPCAPGRDVREGGGLLAHLVSDPGAHFDKVVEIDAPR